MLYCPSSRINFLMDVCSHTLSFIYWYRQSDHCKHELVLNPQYPQYSTRLSPAQVPLATCWVPASRDRGWPLAASARAWSARAATCKGRQDTATRCSPWHHRQEDAGDCYCAGDTAADVKRSHDRANQRVGDEAVGRVLRRGAGWQLRLVGVVFLFFCFLFFSVDLSWLKGLLVFASFIHFFLLGLLSSLRLSSVRDDPCATVSLTWKNMQQQQQQIL